MLRLLPMLIVFGIALIAVIDCLSTEAEEIRGLPKVVWVLIILLFPLLGSLAWFIAGRPPRQASRTAWRPGSGFPEAERPRQVAPDDDPEFLRGLGQRQRREDEEILRRWEDDLKRREDELRRRGDDPATES